MSRLFLLSCVALVAVSASAIGRDGPVSETNYGQEKPQAQKPKKPEKPIAGKELAQVVNAVLSELHKKELTKKEVKALHSARTRDKQHDVIQSVYKSRHIKEVNKKTLKRVDDSIIDKASGWVDVVCAVVCSDTIDKDPQEIHPWIYGDPDSGRIDNGGDPVDHSNSGDNTGGGGDVA